MHGFSLWGSQEIPRGIQRTPCRIRSRLKRLRNLKVMGRGNDRLAQATKAIPLTADAEQPNHTVAVMVYTHIT
jgi:hypothetical protein